MSDQSQIKYLFREIYKKSLFSFNINLPFSINIFINIFVIVAAYVLATNIADHHAQLTTVKLLPKREASPKFLSAGHLEMKIC